MSVQRVLVVEDNDDLRDIYGLILVSAGFQVTVARHGLAAWELLPRIPVPHAFVVDLMMPVFDGWGLIDLLRSRKDTKNAAIVAVSAFKPLRDPGSTVDAFLPKPFEPAELVEAVRRTLEVRARPRR